MSILKLKPNLMIYWYGVYLLFDMKSELFNLPFLRQHSLTGQLNLIWQYSMVDPRSFIQSSPHLQPVWASPVAFSPPLFVLFTKPPSSLLKVSF